MLVRTAKLIHGRLPAFSDIFLTNCLSGNIGISFNLEITFDSDGLQMHVINLYILRIPDLLHTWLVLSNAINIF